MRPLQAPSIQTNTVLGVCMPWASFLVLVQARSETRGHFRTSAPFCTHERALPTNHHIGRARDVVVERVTVTIHLETSSLSFRAPAVVSSTTVLRCFAVISSALLRLLLLLRLLQLLLLLWQASVLPGVEYFHHTLVLFSFLSLCLFGYALGLFDPLVIASLFGCSVWLLKTRARIVGSLKIEVIYLLGNHEKKKHVFATW